MEIAFFLIILVFLIIIKSQLSQSDRSLRQLHDELSSVREEIHQLKSGSVPATKEAISPLVEKPVEEVIPESVPIKPAEAIIPIDQTPDMPIIIEEVKNVPLEEEIKISWWKNWLLNNPDIEKFIGENLVNKIGIGILILGIAFFVKYAIDQEWINKVGRVSIGLLCGGILMALAHRLRKNYHSFSSVLVGGGLTVFYFTIAFAFHQYQLIGQAAAFIIMVVITAFAVILSILYDRIELGILATIGGFITPFLVSRGDGNYLVLFTYLVILNAGIIGLAYYKRWRTLNFLAFIFTQIIYIAWIVNKAGNGTFPYRGTFIFGAIFYVMFVVMNVIHHVIRGSKLKAFDFMILLSVNLCFYGSGLYLLQGWGMDMYKGLFTASLAIINLLLAYFLFRKSKADKNFIYLLIGITLTFVSLTAPIQLTGHYITLFWSAEIVVLLWLYQKSAIYLMKLASVLITFLMLVSLLMDWQQVYVANGGLLPILFNKGVITSICSAVALLTTYSLLSKGTASYYLSGITYTVARSFYLTAAVIVLFCAGGLEVNNQFVRRLPATGLQFIYLQLYISVFLILLFSLLHKYKITIPDRIRWCIASFGFVLYIFNAGNIYDTEKQLLLSGKDKLYFMASWISFLLILLLARSFINYIKLHKARLAKYLSVITWIISISIIIVLSIEIKHLIVWLGYSAPPSIAYIENLYNKAGLSIIWGICSFIIIWLGMSFRYKPLRIIALVVFGVTLLKLFIADIRNINPGGKIVAFILLGVLLLIISFMYQRLKKILIDDANNSK